MASPVTVFYPSGNVLAPTSVAASGNKVTNVIDGSTDYSVKIQVGNLGGASVSAGATITVNVYEGEVSNGSPQWSTIPIVSLSIPTIASTQAYGSPIQLSTGVYYCNIINNDATYATTVSVTTELVSSVQ